VKYVLILLLLSLLLFPACIGKYSGAPPLYPGKTSISEAQPTVTATPPPVTITAPAPTVTITPAPATVTTPIPTMTVTPTPPATQLTLFKEWSGTGIKTTEPFTIDSQPWKIEWSSDPVIMGGQSVGMLQIMVYDSANPNFPITLAANTSEKASDTSYIYRRGAFYLTVNAANTNWTVKIYR